MIDRVARIDALGAERDEDVFADREAALASSAGSSTSRVVPGYVVLSSTTSMPGCA